MHVLQVNQVFQTVKHIVRQILDLVIEQVPRLKQNQSVISIQHLPLFGLRYKTQNVVLTIR